MGVFKNMLIDRDMEPEEELLLEKNQLLQERITGLMERMNEIRNRKIDETSKEAERYFGTRIGVQEMDQVLPKDFWSVSDLMIAIERTQSQLLDLWTEMIGTVRSKPDGQISLFDICNIYTGQMIAA